MGPSAGMAPSLAWIFHTDACDRSQCILHMLLGVDVQQLSSCYGTLIVIIVMTQCSLRVMPPSPARA